MGSEWETIPITPKASPQRPTAQPSILMAPDVAQTGSMEQPHLRNTSLLREPLHDRIVLAWDRFGPALKPTTGAQGVFPRWAVAPRGTEESLTRDRRSCEPSGSCVRHRTGRAGTLEFVASRRGCGWIPGRSFTLWCDLSPSRPVPLGAWGRAAKLLNEPAALDRVDETTLSAGGMDNDLLDADNPEEESAIENEVTV